MPIPFLAAAALSNAESFDIDVETEMPSVGLVTPIESSDLGELKNSTTILRTTDLLDLGIDNMVDALRLVPGMIVSELHGSRVSIDYHGGNSYRTRRSEVLFNSQELNRPFDQNILWRRLPIGTSDVSYIKVLRGTSVVDYGGNSFLSAVNLVQNPIVFQPGVSLTNKSTTEGNHDLTFSFQKRIDQSMNNFRMRKINYEGFDNSPQSDELKDGYEGYDFLWNGELANSSSLLDWSLIVSDYAYDFPTLNSLSNDDPDASLEISTLTYPFKAKNKTYRLALKHQGTNSRYDWNYGALITKFNKEQQIQICLPAFIYDPILAELDAADNVNIVANDFDLLVGSAFFTGTGQLNESILSPLTSEQQGLLQDFGSVVQNAGLSAVTREMCGTTSQDSDVNQGTLTGGLKMDATDDIEVSTKFLVDHSSIESESFFEGGHERTSFEWGNNISYFPSSKHSIHVGSLTEYNTDIDRAFTSTRAAFNYRIIKNHSIRFKIAQSFRLPSRYETNRIQQFYVTYYNNEADYNGNTSSDILRRTVSKDLDPEKIISKELEYIYSDNDSSAYTFKIFHEKRYNLISETLSYVVNRTTNNGASEISGFELGTRHELNNLNDLVLGSSYSYMDTDTSTLEESTLVADWAASVWAVLPTSSNTTIGIAHFRNDSIASEGYKRTDLNFNWNLKKWGSNMNLSVNYRRYPKSQTAFTQFSPTDPLITNRKSPDVFSLKFSADFD
jgi:outer membrane receptor protein involved in Fe transport